jgi:hypothetical protein
MVVPNRELTEEEVLSIFEHVHHNHSLPPDLKYQVIPVDPNGSKISPPRFNFSGTHGILVRHLFGARNALTHLSLFIQTVSLSFVTRTIPIFQSIYCNTSVVSSRPRVPFIGIPPKRTRAPQRGSKCETAIATRRAMEAISVVPKPTFGPR